MLQNYNVYRVLSLFLSYPLKGFKWRDVSKELKLGFPSTKKYIEELKKEGLIVERIVYGRKLYFANRESRKFKIYKIFDILLGVENSGLIDFLNREFRFPAIILFGSFALGEATEKSDIDVAVISDVKKDIDVTKYEKRLKRPVHLFVFSDAEFNNMKEKNRELYNNIANGIVLSGYLKVI